MMKNDKKNEKKWLKKWKNPRKIAIFHFLEDFSTTGSKNDEKWFKKNDLKNENSRGKLQFSIFWKMFAPLGAKMMKHDKKNEKMILKMKKWNQKKTW
jgi:hypothetical protein